MVVGLAPVGELYCLVLNASWALFGIFPPNSVHVPFFPILYYSLLFLCVLLPLLLLFLCVLLPILLLFLCVLLPLLLLLLCLLHWGV